MLNIFLCHQVCICTWRHRVPPSEVTPAVSSAKNSLSTPTLNSVSTSGTTCLEMELEHFVFKSNTIQLSLHVRSSQLNGLWKVTKATNGVTHKLISLVAMTSRYVLFLFSILLFYYRFIHIYRAAKRNYKTSYFSSDFFSLYQRDILTVSQTLIWQSACFLYFCNSEIINFLTLFCTF